MREIKYVIQDELGIHARPAGLLVKMFAGFSSNIQVGTPQKMVNGKRIFGVMGLGLGQGDELSVTFDGPDEDAAVIQTEAFLRANL